METVYEYVHFEAKVQSTVCKNKTRHFRIVYSIEDYVNLETGGISFKENFAEFAVLLCAACPEKKKYISVDRNSNRRALPPQALTILIAFLSSILVPFTLDTCAAIESHRIRQTNKLYRPIQGLRRGF